jgi:raffinose/stachyose/melibiose transport system substrate-binding protein
LTTSEAAHRITNQLIGNFALHKKKPEVRDLHAQRFFSLLEDRKTDVVWSFPKLDAKIPSGNTLIKEASVAVTKGEMTPQEAANYLQQGVAEWYTPAQTCGENDG